MQGFEAFLFIDGSQFSELTNWTKDGTIDKSMTPPEGWDVDGNPLWPACKARAYCETSPKCACGKIGHPRLHQILELSDCLECEVRDVENRNI